MSIISQDPLYTLTNYQPRSIISPDPWSSISNDPLTLTIHYLPETITFTDPLSFLIHLVNNQNNIQNLFTSCQIPVYVLQISLGLADYHVVCIKSYRHVINMVCMISMNHTEKQIPGYAFNQENKTTWRYLCNLPNIWCNIVKDTTMWYVFWRVLGIK